MKSHYPGNSVLTGCRDCGCLILHSHPLSNQGRDDFKSKFDNVHVSIFYDMATKHYLHIIKGSPEKLFCSCRNTIEQLIGDKEIKRVLEWAHVPEALIQQEGDYWG